MKIPKQIDRPITYKGRRIRITPGLWTKVDCNAGEKIYLEWTNVPSGRLLVSYQQESIVANPITLSQNSVFALDIGHTVPANFGDSNDYQTFITCMDGIGAGGTQYSAKLFVTENFPEKEKAREIFPACFRATQNNREVIVQGAIGGTLIFPENAFRISAILQNITLPIRLCDVTGANQGIHIAVNEKVYFSALDGICAPVYARELTGLNSTVYISEFLLTREA